MRSIRSRLLLLLAFTTLFSCVTPVPVEFRRIENFKTSLDEIKPIVSLDLVINNPNPYSVTVTEVSSDLFLNNQSVSRITLPSKKRIERSGESSLPIVMHFDLNHAISLIPAAVPALLTRTIDTRISGHIRIRKFIFKRRIPFSVSQKLSF